MCLFIAENREQHPFLHSKLRLELGTGWNIASYASPAARNFEFLIVALRFIRLQTQGHAGEPRTQKLLSLLLRSWTCQRFTLNVFNTSPDRDIKIRYF